MPLSNGKLPRSTHPAVKYRVHEKVTSYAKEEGSGGYKEGGDDMCWPSGTDLEGMPSAVGEGGGGVVVVL